MSGLLINGSKATEKISLPDFDNSSFDLRVKVRTMSEDDFIENHSSGTLRKNKRLGFHYKKQYLHERIAFDFGYGFEAIPESRINWGQPITEGDCSAITEAGWFIDRYQFFAFPGDTFEAKYLHVSAENEPPREGPGIIIRKTSASYIPSSHVVFAIIAEVNSKDHCYYPARNPF